MSLFVFATSITCLIATNAAAMAEIAAITSPILVKGSGSAIAAPTAVIAAATASNAAAIAPNKEPVDFLCKSINVPSMPVRFAVILNSYSITLIIFPITGKVFIPSHRLCIPTDMKLILSNKSENLESLFRTNDINEQNF